MQLCITRALQAYTREGNNADKSLVFAISPFGVGDMNKIYVPPHQLHRFVCAYMCMRANLLINVHSCVC